MSNKRAVCQVCPRACALFEGAVGACRARVNIDGEVVALNYGKATSLALDPVEKKPFAQWMKGHTILSVGSFGCNLHCPFCQNYTIAQAGQDDIPWKYLSPHDLVEAALRYKDQGNVGIAFTYNEPLVGFEYIIDTARLAHEQGLLCALVTNGVANPAVFDAVIGLMDAANIDLKGFSHSFYEQCGLGAFETVKRNIAHAIQHTSCHVEITSLIVPELSNAEEMEQAAQWIAELDKNTPYHISQYHPAYRMTTPALSCSEVKAYAQRAQKYVAHVYTGNM